MGESLIDRAGCIQIVDKTIVEADQDRDGKISFEEFTKMVENTDVSMSMTLGAALPSSVSAFACHLRAMGPCTDEGRRLQINFRGLICANTTILVACTRRRGDDSHEFNAYPVIELQTCV